jgi:hypothetical protein
VKHCRGCPWHEQLATAVSWATLSLCLLAKSMVKLASEIWRTENLYTYLQVALWKWVHLLCWMAERQSPGLRRPWVWRICRTSVQCAEVRDSMASEC